MISLKEVLSIHDILIDKFGGLKGVRDLNALESALNRPLQTFEEKELYPSLVEKVSALLESIITNHPFIDGNKRIGYTLCRLILLNNDLDLIATEKEKYFFILQIAENKLDHKQIADWIKNHLNE
jgi:death-on-curing protein